jgi:hypothetical protein
MNISAAPSSATEVMFFTLPTLATEPSIFCRICVSISVGAAPGWLTLTSTSGNEMSGLRLIGRRMKATMPMKKSTTKSTTGGTGFLIDQADMFLITGALPAAERR